MTALLLEYIELIMLFLLIGSVLGLAHVNGGKSLPVGPKARRKHRRLAASGL